MIPKKCDCGKKPTVRYRVGRRMPYFVMCECGAMTPYVRNADIATLLWNTNRLLFRKGSL
jgi:hypothetical protein